MSTISSMASRREAGDAGIVYTVTTVLKRGWVAYINWRIELLAAARSNLRSNLKSNATSDRERRDPGSARPQFEASAGGGHRGLGHCC